MADTVAPEYARFVAAQRRAALLPAEPRPMSEGVVLDNIFIEAGTAGELMRVAARRAAGFFRPSKRTEVVWVEGESELAVGLEQIALRLGEGLLRIVIPVRCDQIGAATVEVLFVCGSPNVPAGLYAATTRKPNGPELVVAAWGDALVAFAWQSVLGLVAGIAGASGKDQRGNLLVPVEMAVSPKGITIMPMARHRFAGASGLKPAAKRSSSNKRRTP